MAHAEPPGPAASPFPSPSPSADLSLSGSSTLELPSASPSSSSLFEQQQGHEMNLVALQPISTTKVTFLIREHTTAGERMCLVGDTNETGQWDVKKSMVMETSPESFPEWKISIDLPTGRPFEYKYLTRGGSQFNHEQLVLRRWEKFKENRKILPEGLEMEVDDGEFGKKDSHQEIKVDEGWLHEETEFRLKIGARHPVPVELRNPQPFRLRVYAINLNSERATNDHVFMKLQVLRYRISEEGQVIPDCFTLTPHNGWKWVPKDVGIFSCRFLNKGENTSVVVEVLTDEENPSVIGNAVIVPSLLEGSCGAFRIPILNGIHPVGHFSVEYLLVYPFEHHLSNISNVLDQEFRSLSIGHRGAGQSHEDGPHSFRSVFTENTIFSFIQAAKKGVDYVEFDVQMSRDRIPIVYHNFKTRLSLERMGSIITDTYDEEVNQLTLKQLRSFKLDFAIETKTKIFQKLLREKMPELLALRQQHHHTSSIGSGAKRISKTWERIKMLKDRIPTLEEVFQNVPIDIGFNIEIKYPVPLVGTKDRDDWEDHNSYVDGILRVIFEKAGKRKIVISCFEPDICTMLRLKQHTYPVFFLTTAGHPKYGANKDARANSLPHAVLFSRSERFLGIVSYSTVLLENPSLISFVKESGLVLFTWGEANNIEENKILQQQLGVDAVISDNAASFRRNGDTISSSSSASGSVSPSLEPLPSQIREAPSGELDCDPSKDLSKRLEQAQQVESSRAE